MRWLPGRTSPCGSRARAGRAPPLRSDGLFPRPTGSASAGATAPKGPLAARFVARRVRLARGRGDRWLRGERRYDLLNLGASASLAAAVRLARSRWSIEQQYREVKDELGFDHFEGPSWPGWTHHVVLTAMAFTFLQSERLQYPATAEPTLPHVRMWLREIVAVLYNLGNRGLMGLVVSFQRNPPLRR